jgi:hypothetical protein
MKAFLKTRPGGTGFGDRLAAFLAGMACGALLQWATGPLGRRLTGFPGPRREEGGAGSAARQAMGRIHDLLGEIRGLMGSPHGRTGEGSPG